MAAEQGSDYTYRVLVDDNFHHMDEEERYELGVFASCEEAVAACKHIIDGFLLPEAKGRTTAELCQLYTMFGDDTFIATSDPSCRFSGWEYARQRCAELVGGQESG